MMRCLRPSPKADILPGTSGGSSFTKRFGMPMAARADFSEKYLTPESGLPKAHNLSSVLAFSNGQSPEASEARPPLHLTRLIEKPALVLGRLFRFAFSQRAAH